jgi:transcriptional regulator with XRE-family HTH domain
MTRAQRAEAIERTVEAISNIERGRSLPPLALLTRIAGLTGCSLVTLVEEPAGEGKVSERAGLETRLAMIGKSLPIEQLRISVGQIAALQAEEG